jgi:hypothetical protein
MYLNELHSELLCPHSWQFSPDAEAYFMGSVKMCGTNRSWSPGAANQVSSWAYMCMQCDHTQLPPQLSLIIPVEQPCGFISSQSQ